VPNSGDFKDFASFAHFAVMLFEELLTAKLAKFAKKIGKSEIWRFGLSSVKIREISGRF